MKQLRLGLNIIQMLTKDRMYYPGRLFADVTAMLMRFGVLVLLYWYVYRVKGGSIAGTDFSMVAWSMFFYFSFSVLRLRDIYLSIMQDIKSGNVETLFTKPISYLGFRMYWQLGYGLYSCAIIFPVGFLIMALTVGIPATMHSWFFVLTAIAVVIGAHILQLILYAIVGLLAFWIEDVKPVFWIVDKAVMILGGSYLPVALFPPIMYKLAILSPFGATQFITHTVYPSWGTMWLQLLAIQLFWIVLLAMVLFGLFASAKKHVSVNGG